jgi:hypothetical protein
MWPEAARRVQKGQRRRCTSSDATFSSGKGEGAGEHLGLEACECPAQQGGCRGTSDTACGTAAVSAPRCNTEVHQLLQRANRINAARELAVFDRHERRRRIGGLIVSFVECGTVPRSRRLPTMMVDRSSKCKGAQLQRRGDFEAEGDAGAGRWWCATPWPRRAVTGGGSSAECDFGRHDSVCSRSSARGGGRNWGHATPLQCRGLGRRAGGSRGSSSRREQGRD